MPDTPTNNSAPFSPSSGKTHGKWIASIGQELQEIYMKQVSKFPMLTPEEEASLTRQYGEAKNLLVNTLKRYPSVFIQMIKEFRTAETAIRVSNFFELDEDETRDEKNVRNIFMVVSARIIELTADKTFPYPDNNTPKADEFWELFAPLKPRQFLFKQASIQLQDEAWRNNVLTAKEWNACKEILAETLEKMNSTSNTLIEHNLRLVISIAGRYINCGIPLQDLVQEGNIGLMRAIERFDYTLERRFSTYASYWIRQAITRNITNHSRIIRMPANTVALISQIRQEEQRHLNETGDMPTPEIIAQKIGVSTAKVRALQEMVQQPISLHTIVNEDKLLIETIADQDSTTPSDYSDVENLKGAVAKLLDVLTDREREVVCKHFGINGHEPQTLTAISKEMGLSRERVRQLEVRALHKLRMPSAMKIIEGYGKAP